MESPNSPKNGTVEKWKPEPMKIETLREFLMKLSYDNPMWKPLETANLNSYYEEVFMLWVLPLEPLKERYTEQWYRWFHNKIRKYNIDYCYIDGDTLTDKVEVGKVLDASGTVYYKAKQIEKISRLFKSERVKSGDKFFLFDGQFFGVESIRYMATLYNVDIEIYCYFHASSYTIEDFTEPMSDWLKYFEVAWFNYYDKIFVGTQYHKNSILNRRVRTLLSDISNKKGIYDKIIVTGTMYDSSEVLKYKSDRRINNRVIYSDRFDEEKRPQWLLHLIKKFPDLEFIVTTSRDTLTTDSRCFELGRDIVKYDNVRMQVGLSKADYYDILSKCSVYVTFSIEENFGICALEAITMGLSPLGRCWNVT